MTAERVPGNLPSRMPVSAQSAVSRFQPSTVPSAVEVQIGELVLDGFDPRHRHSIGDAVERELVRLLEGGEGARGMNQGAEADVTRLDAGSFQAAPDASAASIGAVLAQMIIRALMR